MTPLVAIQHVHRRVSVDRVARSTALRDWSYLRALTRHAEELGLGEDPLARMRKPPVRVEDSPRNPARPMTEEEWGRFSGVVREEDRGRRVPQYPLFLALWETGARIGELAGTRWAYLDLAEEVLVIDAATAKTRRSRAIPLAPVLVPELRKLVPIHERLYARSLQAQDLVFLTALGRPLEKSNLRMYFDRTLAAAGIAKRDGQGRRLSPHSMRHGFASRLARQGVALVHAQKLLGHSTPNLTARIYTHLRVDELRAALAERAWSQRDASPPRGVPVTCSVTGSPVAGGLSPVGDTGPVLVRHPLVGKRVVLLGLEHLGPDEYPRLLAALAAGADVLLVGPDFDGGRER